MKLLSFYLFATVLFSGAAASPSEQDSLELVPENINAYANETVSERSLKANEGAIEAAGLSEHNSLRGGSHVQEANASKDPPVKNRDLKDDNDKSKERSKGGGDYPWYEGSGPGSVARDGLLELNPCKDWSLISAGQKNHEYTDARCAGADTCSGGCCRAYNWLRCDTTNAFSSVPCICNQITRDPNNFARAPTAYVYSVPLATPQGPLYSPGWSYHGSMQQGVQQRKRNYVPGDYDY